jgi:succinyl-diaminopimelate desuccinylase
VDHADIHQRVLKAVDKDEVLSIVQKLVSIPSHWAQQDREKPIATWLKNYFVSEGIEAYLQEVKDGRSNVIATLKGNGSGPSLMFNGHIDTVPPFGMLKPFDCLIKNGCLYGRGTADMKSGVGAMAYALVVLNRLGIQMQGDVVFAGVIDEDAAGSAGTRYLVEHGPKTDFAIVGEPTLLHPVIAHKGIDYFEIIFLGKSVHSSVPGNGVNAIYAATDFVNRVERQLIPRYSKLIHSLVGAPTVNVGLIQGFAKANKTYLLGMSETFSGTVPDVCRVYVDIRWTPNQNLEQISCDIKEMAIEVANMRSGINVEVNYIPLPRPAMEINADNLLVKTVAYSLEKVLGSSLPVKGETYWGDSGLLYGLAGIPTIMFGPGDISCAHSDHECVEISQLESAVLVYALTALNICGVSE